MEDQPVPPPPRRDLFAPVRYYFGVRNVENDNGGGGGGGGGEWIPFKFRLIPDVRGQRQSSLYRRIRRAGGDVILGDSDNNSTNPDEHVVQILNEAYLRKCQNLEWRLPFDTYSSGLCYYWIKHLHPHSDPSKFLASRSGFQPYDVMRILRREIGWSDVPRLAVPPWARTPQEWLDRMRRRRRWWLNLEREQQQQEQQHDLNAEDGDLDVHQADLAVVNNGGEEGGEEEGMIVGEEIDPLEGNLEERMEEEEGNPIVEPQQQPNQDDDRLRRRGRRSGSHRRRRRSGRRSRRDSQDDVAPGPRRFGIAIRGEENPEDEDRGGPGELDVREGDIRQQQDADAARNGGDDDVQQARGQQVAAPRRQRGARRAPRNYSRDDGQKILDVLIKHGLFRYTSGLKLWKQVEAAGILEGRTAWSLQNHFKRTILPQVLAGGGGGGGGYRISPAHLLKLKRSMRKIRRHPGREQCPDVNFNEEPPANNNIDDDRDPDDESAASPLVEQAPLSDMSTITTSSSGPSTPAVRAASRASRRRLRAEIEADWRGSQDSSPERDNAAAAADDNENEQDGADTDVMSDSPDSRRGTAGGSGSRGGRRASPPPARQHLHRRRRRARGRRAYSLAEGQEMLDLVCINDAFLYTEGHSFWKLVVKSQVRILRGRTFQSLLNHFKRTVLKDILARRGPSRYRIGAEDLAKLKDSRTEIAVTRHSNWCPLLTLKLTRRGGAGGVSTSSSGGGN